MQQSKKNGIIILGTVIICAMIIFLAWVFINRFRKDNWADRYRKKLEYNFDENAVNMKVKQKDWKKFASDSYEGAYDFDRDGKAETLKISFSESDGSYAAHIDLEGEEVLQFGLERENRQGVFTVVGIYHESETYIAVLESVYNGREEMGKLRWQIYGYRDGKFVKAEDFAYTGMADGRGIMVEGVIESNCMEKVYSHDVKEHQNNYVYYRSVVFADMKEMGIKLPFETAGRFETMYKRNIKGIFNIIIE